VRCVQTADRIWPATAAWSPLERVRRTVPATSWPPVSDLRSDRGRWCFIEPVLPCPN